MCPCRHDYTAIDIGFAIRPDAAGRQHLSVQHGIVRAKFDAYRVTFTGTLRWLAHVRRQLVEFFLGQSAAFSDTIRRMRERHGDHGVVLFYRVVTRPHRQQSHNRGKKNPGKYFEGQLHASSSFFGKEALKASSTFTGSLISDHGVNQPIAIFDVSVRLRSRGSRSRAIRASVNSAPNR